MLPGLQLSKTKLNVRNLPTSMTDTQLRAIFSKYCDENNANSTIISCKCVNGQGYVIFSDERCAQEANSSRIQLDDCIISTKFAYTIDENATS